LPKNILQLPLVQRDRWTISRSPERRQLMRLTPERAVSAAAFFMFAADAPARYFI
jgi:hypothetical protein